MKLYYFPLSPFSQKTLIALYEKGTAFDPVLVNLGDAAARADFHKINPLGKVPFLVDEGRDWRVPESSIIIEYLDRHGGGAPLIPADPDLGRQTRCQDRIFDLYITGPALEIFFDGRRAAGQKNPVGVADAAARLDKTYVLLDTHFAKRTFAAGESFSLADCAAAPGLAMARAMRPFDAHENLTRYFQRLSERPSVQRAFKEAEAFRARG